MSATCKSCGAAIRWAKTFNSRNMPLDAEPHPEGNISLAENGVSIIVASPRLPPPYYRSHFATCPNAAQHRKAKA